MAAAVVGLRQAGWLSGFPGPAVAGALGLAFPVSRVLPRRVLIAGAVRRITLLMVVAAGATVANDRPARRTPRHPGRYQPQSVSW